MPDEVVQYELSLKDTLSPKVEDADRHVNKFESSMKSLGERVTHVAEAFGISFAIFKGMEFVHEGVEEMEKLHKSEAGLQNTMENMGTYSQEAFDKMVGGAENLAHGVNFTKAEVIELQSQLNLVGNIGEQEMGRLTKVSADLATKMGTSLTEAGNLLAKAINAPEMARRLGMALKIDPGVMQHVQNLAKHGKEAQARMELLAIAESKVGGAAQAAFNADPLAKFNKTMLDLKEETGAAAIAVLKLLAPALEWIAGAFKSTITWMKEHKELLTYIAIAVGVAAVAYGIYLIIVNAVTIATTVWTAVQKALNFVLKDNPIGLVVTAIGVLVSAVLYCYKHFATFRAILWATWGVIKEFGKIVGDVFLGIQLMMHGIATFNLTEIKQGWGQVANTIGDAAKRIGKAASDGYAAGMADFNKDQEEDKKSLIPPPKKTVGKFQADKIAEPKTKATGSKSVTINVSIKDLIGTQNINTTNLKEGGGKIRDMIVQVLTGAVNDFQVVAEH